MPKSLKIIAIFLLATLLLILSIWGTLALYFQGSDREIIQIVVISSFVLISLGTLLSLLSYRWRWRAVTLYSVVFISLLFWYMMITPSNDREWQEDVSLLSYASQSENLITVHNIRNFKYKSEIDYEASYYDKTFDLEKLIGIDVIAVYWMGPSVAHIFLSFSFEGDEHLGISIETRKEVGEEYSTLAGFFRKYELYYVVADERDVIRLRTSYRHNPVEDVYIYPTSGTKEEAQELFLAYIQKINALKKAPEFYNTLTTNCTTAIWDSAHNYLKDLSFSWKILVSGYVPEYLYENNRLSADGVSFLELQKKVYANEKAKKLGSEEDFSKAIRE